MFDKVKILKLRFILKAIERIRLPEYEGSTFRGAFGHAFKKAVCIMKKETVCENCMVNIGCSYYKFFESPIPKNLNDETSRFLRIGKVEKTPHPFIFEPAVNSKKILEEGDFFFFDILLFGKAMEYYPYFVYSISEMGKQGIGTGRGRYEIYNILNFTDEKSTENIYEDNKTLKKIETFLEIKNPDQTLTERITFNFITPLRLQNKGELLQSINFNSIIINLIRKISTILVLHYNYEINEDYKGNAARLIELSR